MTELPRHSAQQQQTNSNPRVIKTVMETIIDKIAKWRAHAKAAFKEIPNSRWYAFTDENKDAFAAVAEAWHEERVQRGISGFTDGDLAKFFSELAKHVPRLVQEKPDSAAPKPEQWIDPVTKEVPRNPWSDPQDLESQAVLLKHDPHLAEHLRRTAKGVSYKFLAEMREADVARARAASISYGAAEHERNPFITGDITAQMRLQKDDPQLAAVYKREAEPLQLPWGVGPSKNLTILSRLHRANQEAASIVQRAETLQHQWLKEQLARSRETEQTARAQREKAEALLRS